MSKRNPTTKSNATKGGYASLLAALLAACIAFQLNASMLSPALVTMARELDTTETVIGISQTLFFTLAALFSLFLPRMSDIFGRKRVLLGMLIIMVVGSVIAALAVNIQMLFIGRIIQGVTGPVVPICLLMLRNSIADPRKYGLSLGILTAVNGGIAGIDALLGGWLATNFGFRSLFWVIAGVTIVSVMMLAVWGVESAPSAGTKMDWIGVLPLVISVASILMAFNEAGKLTEANWLLVGGEIALSLIMFIIFMQVEKRIKEPLVEPKYLKRRSTWALLLTTMLTMTGVFAVVNGLVMSLAQNADVGFGLEADYASLLFLTPYALVGWAVGPFAGRLAPMFGYRRVLQIGLVGNVFGTVIMGFIGIHSLPVLVVTTVLLGITYAGMGNIMLNGLGIVLSPNDNPGFLPGLNAGAFNLGAGISFAVLPAIQMGITAATGSALTGYSGGILVGAGITVLALGCSFLIPKNSGAEVDSDSSQLEGIEKESLSEAI